MRIQTLAVPLPPTAGRLRTLGLIGSLGVLLSACATLPAPLPLHPAAATSDELQSIADAYYRAGSVDELRAAATAARELAPTAALTHELAAVLAGLEARPDAELHHYVEALRDAGNDAPHVHLEHLVSLPTSYTGSNRRLALLRSLADEHPDRSVRSRAAFHLAGFLQRRGKLRAAREAAQGIPGTLRFDLIGPWDNDQSKGYETAFEPETAVDLDASYPGSRVDVSWRRGVRADYRDQYNLYARFSPKEWSVAYAQSTIEVSEAGLHELRITTSDPFKVWVDGDLLYSARRVDRRCYDGFVLPVELSAGAHTVLIKSAQRTGSWWLMARLVRGDGSRPDTITTEALLDARVAHLSGLRKIQQRALWASLAYGGTVAVEAAEALAQAAPSSLTGRYALAVGLWDNQERGRTADLLGQLDEEAGEALPWVRMQRARYWGQSNLRRRAREALVSLLDAHPERPQIGLRLADVFKAEGWKLDRCALLETLQERTSAAPGLEEALAQCLDSLGFQEQAISLYEKIRTERPFWLGPSRELFREYLQQGALGSALTLAKAWTAARPEAFGWWLRLAEAHRRSGQPARAADALQQVLALDPDNADAYQRLGNLAYRDGERATAIARWRESLAREPGNETLTNRLLWLEPENDGGWTRDIPSEERLREAVALREALVPPPGSDQVILFDHEVCHYKADGSTTGVVSLVSHAVNDSGRDGLTQLNARGGSRARILHAFAVAPDGTRVEASSIRRGAVRFRGLEVGSTVVFQYRVEEPPVGFLQQHLARTWFFQGMRAAVVHSEWVLWTPPDTTIHEALEAQQVERSDQTLDGARRVSWTARMLPPLVPEPRMPPAIDTIQHLLVSTVPDWGTFVAWEDELVHEAFRTNADIVDLSERLFAGAEGAQEKVLRIHQHVMQEIRYQQDYENHIAGVRPHAAPVVLQRGYGDCKDKSVLFITLARLAGIQVHFALVRTRSQGRVQTEIPMQQFNHAIVYVPAQEGIPEGRFYDPTADALDLEVLRADDQGTLSLVLDPQTKAYRWVPIPYQAPNFTRIGVETELALTAENLLVGDVTFSAMGQPGAWFRQAARNQELLGQLTQQLLNTAHPGAALRSAPVVEVDDLRNPAVIRADMERPVTIRQDGREIGVKFPTLFRSQNMWALENRRYPLLLGQPRGETHKTVLTLPSNVRVLRLPEAGVIDTPCLYFERSVHRRGRTVAVSTKFEVRCGQVSTEQYTQYRETDRAIRRLIEEELRLRKR